ncbi:hypothetical protein [Bizionia algoritergicola]|uniref:Uncharacterized protein n=2 Tax=Bizionia TaxID=283785 RepID=A0A5D0R270_9FLAO|nr:hypothetical protein [Bizionia algoritergicola]OBX20946.1 hypothetical protein BAA08_14500 [Bizionia sp. APA-3]TYB74604.1 hypothetical protein ES675_00220 [Bizionia algoritergicola]
MKEALINIARTIGAILLLVLALVLFVIVTPFALVWKIWATANYENRKARDILKGISVFFVEIAASYDQLGNAVFGGFFTWLFLQDKELRYIFGDKDETISEVLGWNAHLSALNTRGKWFVKLLDWLDKEHCYKAMMSGVYKARNKVHIHENLKLIT